MKKKSYLHEFSHNIGIQAYINELQEVDSEIIMRDPTATGFSGLDSFSRLLSTLPQEYRKIVEYVQLGG